jgi:threonylcarbamoyladenosine tRNA methylthiotransferase MtaB
MSGHSVLLGKRVAFYTLGCKLNFSESSTTAKMLVEKGAIIVDEKEEADVCIINTCSVTEVADHKCRQAIHRLVKEHPGAFVVVTGCYAQLQPAKVAHVDGVNLLLGAEEKGQIPEYVERHFEMEEDQKALDNEMISVPTAAIRTFSPSCSRGNRTRYFLKVQDGCDYYCTYCTIPFARGRSRNGSIQSMVEQARQTAAEGGKEIVITGVNIGDFGRSTGETFFDLVKALDQVEGIQRFRISSIEPNLITDEIIAYCSTSRAFMPHFHIPLQSGSDEVLKLMHRRYTTDFFAQKIVRIKDLIPDAFIGVDVIVGTRGETDELFEKAYDFIKSLDVSQLHVFSYSERPGTKALSIPYKVSPEVKHSRSQRLLTLSDEKLRNFYGKFIGQVRPVLCEHSHGRSFMHGFTDNYIRVELPADEALDNAIVQVLLGDFNADASALKGTIVQGTPNSLVSQV